MKERRYPVSDFTAALARAAIGVAITATALLLARPGTVVSLILGVLMALFVGYGIWSALRGLTRIRFDDRRIEATGPFARIIPWRDLASVKLSYYTTKRDGDGGWMQLNLKGADRTMRIESTLDGFREIVELAVAVARRQGIELTPATRNNLRPLGIDPEAAHDFGEAQCPIR